jgi:hypothetical protein
MEEKFTAMYFCSQRRREIFVERLGHPQNAPNPEGILCPEARIYGQDVLCGEEQCEIYQRLRK